MLGWLQVHNERRPDLWAFLIHRPMTRTGIFLGKVIAGLGLYALVVGLPLLGFIVWARLPGACRGAVRARHAAARRGVRPGGRRSITSRAC